jgi:hypothetical protein
MAGFIQLPEYGSEQYGTRASIDPTLSAELAPQSAPDIAALLFPPGDSGDKPAPSEPAPAGPAAPPAKSSLPPELKQRLLGLGLIGLLGLVGGKNVRASAGEAAGSFNRTMDRAEDAARAKEGRQSDQNFNMRLAEQQHKWKLEQDKSKAKAEQDYHPSAASGAQKDYDTFVKIVGRKPASIKEFQEFVQGLRGGSLQRNFEYVMTLPEEQRGAALMAMNPYFSMMSSSELSRIVKNLGKAGTPDPKKGDNPLVGTQP